MAIYVISPIVESEAIKLKDSQEFMDKHFPDLNPDHKEPYIKCVFLDKGPTSVENEIDDAISVPGLLEKALWAVEQDAEGILVDCMCDPGVKALRTALNIPVIGPAETAFHLAATLGHRFGVVDIGNDTAPMVEDLVARYGLRDKFAALHGTGIAVEHIGNNTKTQNALYEAALRAVKQDHADVIVLGCTGFAGMAEYIQQRLLQEEKYEVPVIDPLTLAVRTLISIVKEKLCHSKKAYPTPAPKGLKGYDLPTLYKIMK